MDCTEMHDLLLVIYCTVSEVHHRSILLPLLHLTPRRRGSPSSISVKLCTDVSGWLRYKMA